jgi:hypothetical protein
MKKLSMDSFARVHFRHRIVLPTLTRRKEKRKEKNDRDKKKVEKNNNNIFLYCLSL